MARLPYCPIRFAGGIDPTDGACYCIGHVCAAAVLVKGGEGYRCGLLGALYGGERPTLFDRPKRSGEVVA